MSQLSPFWTESNLRAAQAVSLQTQKNDLISWQNEQLQQFLQLGFPDRQDENWKYNSLASIYSQDFSMDVPSIKMTRADIEPYIIEQTYRLVFLNGVYQPALSEMQGLDKKIVLINTKQAVLQYGDQFQSLGLSFSENISAFTFLNGAFLGDGLFLQVPADIHVDKPIHLLYLSSCAPDSVVMCHPRHIMNFQDKCSAVLIEDYVHLNPGKYFNNIVTNIYAGANTHLFYYKIQRESSEALHIANTFIHQQRDSQVKTYHFATGAHFSRDDLKFSLQQCGAYCELTGFYFPQGQQTIDFHTRVDHFQAHTHSKQYYKGILNGRSRGIFNGKIVAHPYAKEMTAQQSNHNLLLSQHAEIDTKPELEVYADQVKCTHGATVGKLDPQILFYLQSRGINRKAAEHLLLSGFVNEIIDNLPHANISDSIRRHVESQFIAALGVSDEQV